MRSTHPPTQAPTPKPGSTTGVGDTVCVGDRSGVSAALGGGVAVSPVGPSPPLVSSSVPLASVPVLPDPLPPGPSPPSAPLVPRIWTGVIVGDSVDDSVGVSVRVGVPVDVGLGVGVGVGWGRRHDEGLWTRNGSKRTFDTPGSSPALTWPPVPFASRPV